MDSDAVREARGTAAQVAESISGSQPSPAAPQPSPARSQPTHQPSPCTLPPGRAAPQPRPVELPSDPVAPQHSPVVVPKPSPVAPQPSPAAPEKPEEIPPPMLSREVPPWHKPKRAPGCPPVPVRLMCVPTIIIWKRLFCTASWRNGVEKSAFLREFMDDGRGVCRQTRCIRLSANFCDSSDASWHEPVLCPHSSALLSAQLCSDKAAASG